MTRWVVRVVVGSIAIAVLVALIVALRTLAVSSYQPEVKPAAVIEIDPAPALARLTRAIQIQTVSHSDQELIDRSAFLAFHRFLEQTFPGAHRVLEREVIGQFSLLYTWRGRDDSLSPIALLGHFDVVPVDPATAAKWEHPPFSGEVADGFLWGRGALDMKQAVVAYLEAVERLLAKGYSPRRSVYLALHHDEEIGGRNGAARIAQTLAERNVRLSFTLDEGSFITDNIVPGVKRPAALIGIAEKGALTLELSVKGESGHSSRPPSQTVIGRLARAIHRLEAYPPPARLESPTSSMFEHLANEMSVPLRAVMANRWLFDPLVLSKLKASATTNALVRTTTATTVLRSTGVKENVLATDASALVNFRLLPGDSVDDVMSHAAETVADAQISIALFGQSQQPSDVSAVDVAAYKVLSATIRRVFPRAVVAPSLVIGGTDSRHYRQVAENSYRFLPVTLVSSDIARIHGVNERIAIDDYLNSIRFYVELLQTVTE